MFQIMEKIRDPYAQKLGPILRYEGVKGGKQRGETWREREERKGGMQRGKKGAEIRRGAAGRSRNATDLVARPRGACSAKAHPWR